jgi:glycerol-3-phosphate O-acyltransferase
LRGQNNVQGASDVGLIPMVFPDYKPVTDPELAAGEGDDGWSAEVWLRLYAAILRNFLEGYRVAARGLTFLLKGPAPEKDLMKKALALGTRMFLSGDIELREAVSKPLLQNALQSFREEGYLRSVDGKHALTASFASAEAVAAIEGRIGAFAPLGR